MAYNDEKYLEAMSMLSTAIGILAANEIPREDIQEAVDNSLDDNFGVASLKLARRPKSKRS